MKTDKQRPRIKLFLGAYINQTNAQNLNCLALAKNLDKQKYDIYALTIRHGNLGRIKIDGVTIFECWYPVRFFSYIGFLWGIMNCDVAYLPRGNNYKYHKSLLRLFNKRAFKTIENIIDDELLDSALHILGPLENVLDNYTFCTRNYSITNFMKIYNQQRWGLNTERVILPLITDTDLFKGIRKVRNEVRGFVFIGNDMGRKGVMDYIKLAAHFNDDVFHIVGANTTGIDLHKIIREFNAQNVVVHGMLKHEALLELLKKVQLHILPSRSEGFPRSIIETATAGIATITYTGYGAEEWIVNGVNGYVVDSFESVVDAINHTKIIGEMQKLSNGAIKLSERFDSKIVVRQYETEIDSLYYA